MLLCLWTIGIAWGRDTLRLDLSKPTIPSVLEFDSEKGHWVDTYDENAQLQFNGVFNLGRMTDSYDGYTWNGFTVGTSGDITDYGEPGNSDGWVPNQWGCMAGGGIKTNAQGWVVKDRFGNVQAEQGIPYLIMFGSENPSMGFVPNLSFELADGVARQAVGVYVCNHPWPYYGNEHGDGFARAMYLNEDFFSLTAHGVHADGSESTSTYMLADFSGGFLRQSDKWEYWDLSELGEVVRIYFRFDSNDVFGEFGINTAAYVCMDRLELLEPEAASPVQVTVQMNPVSNLMKLRNKATGDEVNVGSPMGPQQPNAPKKYTFSTLPGVYTLTGYAPDGTTVIGTIDIEITDQATQTIGIYAATVAASNSGWVYGTDYTIAMKGLSGSDGSVRTYTTGNDNTGRLSFLLLNGDSYLIDLVPSAAKVAEGYMTKTINGTLNGNGTLTGEITMGGNYFITVPYGASVFVGTKPKHYVPFAEVAPESVSTSGGNTVYAFTLANGTQYNYRVSMPGKLTHGGIFYMSDDAAKRPTLTFTEADMNRAQPTYLDRNISGNNVADIFLNINEYHHLRLNVGGEHKMLAQRNWQLVESITNNYFIEPDYHYTVLNANGQPDNSVVRVENVNGISTVKAVGNGTAIVLVTYDAIYLEQYARNTATSKAFVAGNLNGAIWPENTGVFVVTVGDAATGINRNMTINGEQATTQKLAGGKIDAELDVLYYLAPDAGYSYTFKPEGVASVAIAKPTIGANMATYSGFETVQPNADGTYTVVLPHGRSIVRLTNAQGVSDYQVLTAKQANYTISNLTKPGEAIYPGHKVEVKLEGLFHPCNKQSGTYNMSAQAMYGSQSCGGGQYNFASVAKKLTVTIPEDWDADVNPYYVVTDGNIKASGFGDPYGNHRNVSPTEGRSPNFSASGRTAVFGALPDISIKVNKCHEVHDTYSATACGSYEWEGKTYTESGDYTINLEPTFCGAAHTKTLHLTINQPVTHEFTLDAVGSYTWNGQEYTTSGDHVQTFTAANGCDSIVTLHLTVMPAEWTLVGGVAINSNTNCDNTSALADGGYFHAVIANGDMQWQRGYIHVFSNYEVTWSLESVVGDIVEHDYNEYWGVNEKTKWCQMPYNYGTFTLVATRTDNGEQQRIHVIVEETLSADPIAPVFFEFAATACELYDWNGQVYTASGDHQQTFTLANGGDSIVTMHLTINQPVNHEFTLDVYGSYTWNGQEYTTSGDYVQTFTAANGCDSVVTLHLTVTPLVLTEPTVYFAHADGRKQMLDANNAIELTVLNAGRFHFEGEGCTVLDKWDGREETLSGSWHYWLDQWSDDNTNCRYNPRTTTDGRQITISYKQNGVAKTLSFTLRVVASAIEEIKAYVGDTELTMAEPYTVQGNEFTTITVKGRHTNQTEWVELPASSYSIADHDKVHVIGNSFSLWLTGEYVLSVEMKDSDLKLDFKVVSAFVPLTDFTVLVPSTWTIEKWNTLNDKYVGISEVDMADKDNGYVLTFAPANASNTELEWESLTPEVAEFDPLHSNGIVPNKAGEARFRVRSVSNPELEREVSVTFVYKNPLLSVSGPSELHLNAGEEFDLGAQLSFNPADATEQRLGFAYSVPGLVEAACTVEVAGGVGAHTTTHTLTALANGVTTLTCTPYDQSAGAQPFDVIVRVGSFTLNYTAAEGGSISGDANQTVAYGASGTAVEAIANEGYRFVKWSDGLTTATREDANVQADLSVTAEFEEVAPVVTPTTYYAVSLSVSDAAAGTVSGAGDYEENAEATVEATANEGYRFVQWSNGETANPYTFTVTSDTLIMAEFEAIPTTPATGLFDNAIESLSVYPNPTTSGIYVEGNGDMVRIFSMGGQLMLQQPAFGRTYVDLERLPAGTYIVRLGNAQGKVVKK